MMRAIVVTIDYDIVMFGDNIDTIAIIGDHCNEQISPLLIHSKLIKFNVIQLEVYNTLHPLSPQSLPHLS